MPAQPAKNPDQVHKDMEGQQCDMAQDVLENIPIDDYRMHVGRVNSNTDVNSHCLQRHWPGQETNVHYPEVAKSSVWVTHAGGPHGVLFPNLAW